MAESKAAGDRRAGRTPPPPPRGSGPRAPGTPRRASSPTPRGRWRRPIPRAQPPAHPCRPGVARPEQLEVGRRAVRSGRDLTRAAPARASAWSEPPSRDAVCAPHVRRGVRVCPTRRASPSAGAGLAAWHLCGRGRRWEGFAPGVAEDR